MKEIEYLILASFLTFLTFHVYQEVKRRQVKRVIIFSTLIVTSLCWYQNHIYLTEQRYLVEKIDKASKEACLPKYTIYECVLINIGLKSMRDQRYKCLQALSVELIGHKYVHPFEVFWQLFNTKTATKIQ